MGNETNFNIAVISDQALRGAAISKAIKDGFKQKVDIPVLPSDQTLDIERIPMPLLLIVDLMGSGKSYKEILNPIREKKPEVKIIVLHMYRSSILVNPLLRTGINGYVYYEPSREELLDAIETVQAGRKYIPDYLITA